MPLIMFIFHALERIYTQLASIWMRLPLVGEVINKAILAIRVWFMKMTTKLIGFNTLIVY